MGITTRSGYSTEPTDPTPPADNGDLWAFVNHPERWQETFYTTFVDSDEEEDEMIGQENSTVADEDDESESIANAMEMDDELKDSDGAVGRHEMGELGWDYMERDGYALFKGKELDDRNEDPMDDDDEADGDISDHVSDTIDEEFDAAFVEDVETQEDGIHSNSTDYGSDAGETDNEGADSPQSDDKAQIENLDPSNNHHLPYDCCYSLRETRSRLVGKEKGKTTVGNTATVVQDAGDSICRQNSSVPGVEKKGILINAVQRSVNTESMRTVVVNVEKTGIIQTTARMWRSSEGNDAPTAMRKDICAKPAQAGCAFIVREQTTDLIPVLSINRQGIENTPRT